MNIESTNTIICRKCGGPHFTIKCGKAKPEPVPESVQNQVQEPKLVPGQLREREQNQEREPVREQRQRYNNDYKNNKRDNFSSKKTYRVKLSELPKNMTEEELMEMTFEWGHIVKIKVLNYEETSVSYIDFGFEDEATYFIEAIDKTPLESLLLSAIRVDSY